MQEGRARVGRWRRGARARRQPPVTGGGTVLGRRRPPPRWLLCPAAGRAGRDRPPAFARCCFGEPDRLRAVPRECRYIAEHADRVGGAVTGAERPADAQAQQQVPFGRAVTAGIEVQSAEQLRQVSHDRQQPRSDPPVVTGVLHQIDDAPQLGRDVPQAQRSAPGCSPAGRYPHHAAHRQLSLWPRSCWSAEGQGFEPWRTIARPSGFQDRRHRPLGEPSWPRVAAVPTVHC